MGAFPSMNDTFVVVVDIQERLHAAMDPGMQNEYVRNAVILVEAARKLGLPLVVTEQYPRGLGPTIVEIGRAIEGVPRMEKTAFSCMREQSVRDRIVSTGRRTAVIAGIEAHVCVMQTALDMLDAGMTPIVAADAVCSRRMRDASTALDAVARLGVLVYPSESIVFMLLERAATPEFKALSPLFK